MRRSLVTQMLFILYCLEAGLFLLVAPWAPSWERMLFELPLSHIFPLALHPLGRAVVSGFGVIHLVWSAHDFDRLLLALRPDRNASSEPV